MKNLQIDTLILGGMGVNCYLARNKKNGTAFLVDPGDEPDKVIAKVHSLGAHPEAILLTHGHFDHIGAVDPLRREYRIPVYALEKEQEILENPQKNLSIMVGGGFIVKADQFLKDGDWLTLAGTRIQVIHTPGHTVGGTCYYLPDEGVLFSGDTLFCCSVGRTDFPTGSMGEIHRSLHDKLYLLPDDTAVLPGHDRSTDIGYEKKFNPY